MPVIFVLTSPSKVTSPPEVFKEISAEIVTSPVYVCVDEVVTSLQD
jgi:hypothetical protein